MNAPCHDMTHTELTRLAAEWLKRPASRNGPGCQVVVTEGKIGWNEGEIPDAIGFRAAVYQECSVLVECKVSRSDFLADAQKPHRIAPETGMGLYRYYMAPAGVIEPEALPPGWGLVEVTTRGSLKVLRGHVLLKRDEEDSFRHAHNQQNEWALLARTLYRVGDPDAVNIRIREAFNRANRLAREVDDLRNKLRKMEAGYFHLYSTATEEDRRRAAEIRRGGPVSKEAIGDMQAMPRRVKEG